MRFRLFRSRAFWFGVPGLVFLLWAWGLSKTYGSYVMGASDVPEMVFGQLNGDVYYVRSPGPVPPFDDWAGVHKKANFQEAAERKRDWEEYEEAGVASVTFIPHRLLVGVYSLVWAGLVFWRSRKYRAQLPESGTE